MGETTTPNAGLLSWGLSLCMAAAVSVRDLVAGRPELQAAAKEAKAPFELEEPGGPETGTGETVVGTAAGSAPTPSDPIVTAEGTGSGTLPGDGGSSGATLPETSGATTPVTATEPTRESEVALKEEVAPPTAPPAPTPKQRIKAVRESIVAAQINDRYWPTATDAERTALKTFGADFKTLAGDTTERGAEAMEVKLRELTSYLQSIESAAIAFDYKIKQIKMEWDGLYILYASTIMKAPDDVRGELTTRAEVATDAYYAEILKERKAFRDAAMSQLLGEMRAVTEGLLVYDPGAVATKDATLFKAFDPTAPSTWDVRPMRVVGKAASYISAGDADAARIENASVGDENNKNLIVTGVAMHRHATGGSEGISFAYNHLGGQKVEPVIYDYASKRQDNDYVWETHGRCGGPAGFGSVVINRSVPPPYR